jgi:precorrin isomerase
MIDEIDEEESALDQLEAGSDHREEQGSDTITISREQLEELVNNLKLRHRAEIDAIMVEQGVYKRIIQQMIQRFRQQEKKIEAKDLEITGL